MTTVLDLDGVGGHLVVTVELHPVPGDTPLFEVAFEVDAAPFHGSFSDLMMVEDLARFRDNLRGLTSTGEVILGGERAAELTLAVDLLEGDRDGKLVVEVSIASSGDDPWPRLAYLIQGVPAFSDPASATLDALLEGIE